MLFARVFGRFRIIALHSVLSSREQAAAFSTPPAGVRKIVIATNIAETGITIPDVSFVVDSGKVKENRCARFTAYNRPWFCPKKLLKIQWTSVDAGILLTCRYLESSRMSALEEVWVSKASAKQRQGRAGRVREGHCFRLYTRDRSGCLLTDVL